MLSVRERILDETRVLCSEQGFGALTMRRVAGRVGITAPALYRHFSGKADLISGMLDQAREQCEALAAKQGYRYIHSGNEPLLIAGVATETLEILEDQQDVEVIIVPIGGGSGAAGVCIVAKAIHPAIQIIGVQAERAPAAYRSWKERRLVEDKMETAAEGLATRTVFALPQSILWDLLDDFVLVSEEEIYRAIVLYLKNTHNLAEGAGAAPLAAALKMQERLQGRKVALVLSGGNLSLEQLRGALEA